jgi:hypothetical protein
MVKRRLAESVATRKKARVIDRRRTWELKDVTDEVGLQVAGTQNGSARQTSQRTAIIVTEAELGADVDGRGVG